MYTVAELKDSVAGLLPGRNLNNVTNLDGAIQRAVRNLLQQVDIPDVTETKSYTLYDGVTEYPAPLTIFGGALLDFRPQGVGRNFADYTYKKYIADWDREKNLLPSGCSIAFEHRKGVGIARISSPTPNAKIVLDQGHLTTGWTAGGDATALTKDDTVYYEQPSSLRFNLTALGSNGYIEKTISQQDFTKYAGVGVVFLAVRIPNATAITSFGARIGSDSSNYYNVSNTSGFLGSWKAGEWTIIALDLATATETGTVDVLNIEYLRVYVNYDGTALQNVYLGAVWASLPSPHEMIFYSSAIFLDQNGEHSKVITSENDFIVLDDSAYSLLEYETAITIILQSGGSIAEGLGQVYHTKLHGNGNDLGLYALYRADNPSEEVRQVGNWYM